jgi:hypothetical protein
MMKQSKASVLRFTCLTGILSVVISLTACNTLQPAKEVSGLKLVLTEKGTINFADDKGKLVEGVPSTELKGYASNEILNITSYTVIQLKKNPCYVLICGTTCAWKKVSDGPCPPQ